MTKKAIKKANTNTSAKSSEAPAPVSEEKVSAWTEVHTSYMASVSRDRFKDLQSVEGLAKHREKVPWNDAPENVRAFLLTTVVGLDDPTWENLITSIKDCEIAARIRTSKGRTVVSQLVAMEQFIGDARSGILENEYGSFLSNPFTGEETFTFTIAQYESYCAITEFDLEQSDGSYKPHRMTTAGAAIYNACIKATLSSEESVRTAKAWVQAHPVLPPGCIHTANTYSGGGWNSKKQQYSGNGPAIAIFKAGLIAKCVAREATKAEQTLANNTCRMTSKAWNSNPQTIVKITLTTRPKDS